MMPTGPDSQAPPLPGADNYQIGRTIARGGMGSILGAEDGKLKRTVALKMMLLDAHGSAAMQRRFIREAEVLATLEHPNIVPIHDIVWEDGAPIFYTMKLVKGRTLGAILQDLRQGHPDVLREYNLNRLLVIFRKVCDAMAFAHSRGILHRDLKPDNIMVGEFGEVLVMDWGLAKRLRNTPGGPPPGADSAAPPAMAPMSSDDLATHPTLVMGPAEFSGTLQGTVMGTPQYISPEQARGMVEELDDRSDIFSLGGILYAILTLRPPVEGATLEEVLQKVISAQITPPTAHGRSSAAVKTKVLDAQLIKPLPHVPGGRIPGALSSVAMHALELDKAHRYPTVSALSADIEAYQAGFATSTQQAGTLRQLQLLMLRHKAVSGSLAALLVFSIVFVLKLMASERRATQSAEESRRSLATAQIALADVALKRADPAAMAAALETVPPDLRNQSWHYISAKRDSSLGPLLIPGFCEQVSDVCAVASKPGVFVIASRDGKVGVVDVKRRTLLRTIDTRKPGEVRIAVSDQPSRLLCRTSSASEADLYDLSTGAKLKSIRVFPSQEPSHPHLQTVALNPTGNLAAVAGFDRDGVILIDVATGARRWSRGYKPMQMIFHPDGKTLIVAQYQNYFIQFVNVADGANTPSPGLFSPVQSIALSPNGQQLAIGLNSGDVEYLSGTNFGTRTRNRISNIPIAQIALTARGNLMSLDGNAPNDRPVARTLRLWDGIELLLLNSLFGIDDYPGYMPLCLNRGSGHMLTNQSPPQLWQINDGYPSHMIGGVDRGWSCRFLSNTDLLARKEYSLLRYDVSNPRHPVVADSAFDLHHVVCELHPEAGLLATACAPGFSTAKVPAVALWRSGPAGFTRQWSMPATDAEDCSLELSFDAQGGRLARSTDRDHLQVIDAATGRVLTDLVRPVQRAAFAGAADRMIVISGTLTESDHRDGTAEVIDPADGSVHAAFRDGGACRSLAISPDRRLAAIGTDDGEVVILDADTLAVRHRYRAHDSFISALTFHPTLPILATGSDDHTLKLWHYPTARLRESFIGIRGHPRSITFSPNGRLLASDGRHYLIRLFEVQP